MLNAAFTVYSAKSGCLLVACLDELTKAWYKHQVANLELEGQALRAWGLPPLPEYNIARVTVNNLEHSAEEVLLAIKGYNTIQGSITLHDKEIQVWKGHRTVSLEVDDEAAASLAIAPNHWFVKLGSATRKVQYTRKLELLARCTAITQTQNWWLF